MFLMFYYVSYALLSIVTLIFYMILFLQLRYTKDYFLISEALFLEKMLIALGALSSNDPFELLFFVIDDFAN